MRCTLSSRHEFGEKIPEYKILSFLSGLECFGVVTLRPEGRGEAGESGGGDEVWGRGWWRGVGLVGVGFHNH